MLESLSLNIVFYFCSLKELFVFFFFTLVAFLNTSYLSANARYNANMSSIMSSFFLFVLFLILFIFDNNVFENVVIENKYLHINNESYLFIMICLVFSLIYFIIIYLAYKNSIIKSTAELPLIVFISILGGIIIIYTYNPIIMILGLEIQSFCLYALAGFRTNSVLLRTKAGIHYFMYGAIASICILLGISLFFFFYGTTNFITISNDFFYNNVTIISLSLFSLGISIKLGMPPMYKWIPSVYSSTHSIMVLFFALVPKISLLYILTVIGKITLFSTLENLIISLGFIIGIISVLRAEDLGSFIAYTTIVGNCFFFSLLLIPEHFQIITFLLYFSWYQLGITVFFLTCIFTRRRDNTPLINNISDLRLFKSKANSNGEIIIVLLLWAAQPPFVSFFAKFFLYLNGALTINIFMLAMVLIFSIIASFYLIRIISYVIIFYKENIETYVALKKSAYKYNNYLRNIKNTEYIEHISYSSLKYVKENKLIYSKTTRLTDILIILLSHFCIFGPVLLYFKDSQDMVLESLLFCSPLLPAKKEHNEPLSILAIYYSLCNRLALLTYHQGDIRKLFEKIENNFPKKMISLLYKAENNNEYSFQTLIALCAIMKKKETFCTLFGDPFPFYEELGKFKKIISVALKSSSLSNSERAIIYCINKDFSLTEKAFCLKYGYNFTKSNSNFEPKIISETRDSKKTITKGPNNINNTRPQINKQGPNNTRPQINKQGPNNTRPQINKQGPNNTRPQINKQGPNNTRPQGPK